MTEMIDQRDWVLLPGEIIFTVSIKLGVRSIDRRHRIFRICIKPYFLDVTPVGGSQQQHHAGTRPTVKLDPSVIQRIPIPSTPFLQVLGLSHGNGTQLIAGGAALRLWLIGIVFKITPEDLYSRLVTVPDVIRYIHIEAGKIGVGIEEVEKVFLAQRGRQWPVLIARPQIAWARAGQFLHVLARCDQLTAVIGP